MKQELYNEIIQEMDLSKNLTDEEVYNLIDEKILNKSKEKFISVLEKSTLRKEIFNSIRKLDVLQELLEDDTVTEIMINGYKNIFIEQNGKIRKWEKCFSSEEKLENIIQQVVAKVNRIVNESSPIVDARLSDGSRVNVVLNPISLDGSTMTIRKFPKYNIDMKKLIELGSVNIEVANILKLFVKSKYNIFISGGTGSGKTTFLNALSEFIPEDERIITIEDSAELKINGIENLIRLETRNANIEGNNEIKMKDLIKSSLRMRPDRIIVGEVRSDEAIDMLQAMNTGHDGSISTGHANSCNDMLNRLETMVLMGIDMPVNAIRKQISSAIDIIIQLGRIRDKTRKVLEISEVLDIENGEIKLNKIYSFIEETEIDGKVIGKLKKVNDLINVNKLKNFGIYEEYLNILKGGVIEKGRVY